MKQNNPCLKWVIITGFMLLSAAPSLEAKVTNEGNKTVMVRVINHDNTSMSYTLNSGQSISLSRNVKAITVPFPAFGVGAQQDEVVKVSVTEEEGTVGYIEKLGGSYVLGVEKQDEAVTLTKGLIQNSGNVTVNVDIRNRNGIGHTKTVYAGASYGLDKNTFSVAVLNDRTLHGDEIISLSVVLPDGSTSTITRLGGIFKIQEDT